MGMKSKVVEVNLDSTVVVKRNSSAPKFTCRGERKKGRKEGGIETKEKGSSYSTINLKKKKGDDYIWDKTTFFPTITNSFPKKEISQNNSMSVLHIFLYAGNVTNSSFILTQIRKINKNNTIK